MTFRTRLLLAVAVSLTAAVGVVAVFATAAITEAFQALERQRTEALLTQFRTEFARRAAEIAGRIEGIAASDAVVALAVDLNRPDADPAAHVEAAAPLAQAHRLDFLEIVAADGAIVSSAHYPARFGYREEWLDPAGEWKPGAAFLQQQETSEGAALTLTAVRRVEVGERPLFVAGGERLDAAFLSTLVLPKDMRAALHTPGAPASAFDGLAEEVRRAGKEKTALIGQELVQAIPLPARDKSVPAVLLVASSRADLARLIGFVRYVAAVVGVAGILVGLAIAWWATARVTRPVKQLAAGARAVSSGRWDVHVETRAGGEIGDLGRAFNQMTAQLAEQRERLVQSERVAAWRELARRLAHELKNPLFPLQITVENLKRARSLPPGEFDEIFEESTGTLLGEIGNLKRIVGRFSDFARMPRPEFGDVDVNALAEECLRLYEPMLEEAGIVVERRLDAGAGILSADADLLKRAVQNLLLNARDAMPQGGTLTVVTRAAGGGVEIEVADTGSGLTPEECERLFTPYYTTKQYGTGLGLAIVQSVVSDHGGRVSVRSRPGEGAAFTLLLPRTRG